VELSVASLNQGDSFVLDAGTKIFLWNGKGSNPMEKAKATDCALRMKNKDKKGKAEIVVIGFSCSHHPFMSYETLIRECAEEGKPNNEEDEEEFWSLMGGKVSVASAEAGGEDDAVDIKDTLYR